MQLGIDVFTIRYTWSRENFWTFSIEQSKENINDAIDFIHWWKGISLFDNKEISLNYQKIFLLGFSFGGLPTIFSKHFSDVQKILCCPFVNYKIHLEWWGENLSTTFDFLMKWYTNLYTIDKEKIIKELQTINYNFSDKKSEYIVISGAHDEAIPTNEIEWFMRNYPTKKTYKFEMGHSINLPQSFLIELFQN